MDPRQLDKMMRISKRVTEGMQKEGLIRERPFEQQMDRLKELRKKAVGSDRKALDRAINSERLQQTANRETTRVNEDYHKHVAAKMEHEMKKAIKSGELKPADKHESAAFMNKVWQKKS